MYMDLCLLQIFIYSLLICIIPYIPHFVIDTIILELCVKTLKLNQKHMRIAVYTVEPPNKGHFGANNFVPCREVVPISEVKYVLALSCNKCPL